MALEGNSQPQRHRQPHQRQTGRRTAMGPYPATSCLYRVSSKYPESAEENEKLVMSKSKSKVEVTRTTKKPKCKSRRAGRKLTKQQGFCGILKGRTKNEER